MMNANQYNKALSLMLVAAFMAFAELAAVNVPVEMLHPPGGGMGYLGKATYTLNPETYDSCYVTFQILPVGGGAPLALDALEGAVGNVHILPNTPQRDIFFRCSGPVSGQYIARVTVDAVVTYAMQKSRDMVAAEAIRDNMVRMFSGDGNFFETPGLSNAAGAMPSVKSSDGPHGVAKKISNVQATAFSTDGGLACTWDVQSAYDQGLALGEEFRAYDRNVQLGPAMNCVWHPQGGRAFEYFSEDPYLSGKIAAAEVKGIQQRGVIACIKHYVCNEKEDDRNNLSAQVDERSVRELFMPPFRTCVVEAGALSIMTAYNAVNGVFCTGNKYIMTDVARNDWGFIGYSMSDWGALYTSIDDCIRYGVDQHLPDRAAYDIGNFSRFDISYTRAHAQRIIYANAKVGLLNPGYVRTAYANTFKSQAHKTLVRQIGAKALVLAKNDGNVLPIPKTGKKIFLTGPEINVARLGGGDTYDWESSLINADEKISPQQGITAFLNSLPAGHTTIVTNMLDADYIIVAVGVHGEGEGKDRTNPYVQDETAVTTAMAVTTAKTIVLFTGGSAALPGQWNKAPAVLICFGPGQEQGYSIADVIFGDVNPGGKLNCTFPASLSQLQNFSLSNRKLYYPRYDTAHGYFRVNTLGQAPLFAFGHGLSYATFAYSNLSIYPASIAKGDRVYVSVDVKNTGAVKGDEVVQLYLSLPQGTVPVRKQDLRGFSRITLDPQQSKKVTFALDYNDMAYFKTGTAEFNGTGKWDVLAGTYTVRVGTSSAIAPQPEQPSINGAFSVN